ncbi:hypothetical protein P5673_004000 [Acropora cervicornis]|uniref:Uncharacterized protein n=1 Tax=Acropora cervicornis TaxID=6130 RepID=A0AAD9R1G3_ACRCE|nr:hypothetical protein P5673_004000 [Acropora cervicornis]
MWTIFARRNLTHLPIFPNQGQPKRSCRHKRNSADLLLMLISLQATNFAAGRLGTTPESYRWEIGEDAGDLVLEDWGRRWGLRAKIFVLGS